MALKAPYVKVTIRFQDDGGKEVTHVVHEDDLPALIRVYRTSRNVITIQFY